MTHIILLLIEIRKEIQIIQDNIKIIHIEINIHQERDSNTAMVSHTMKMILKDHIDIHPLRPREKNSMERKINIIRANRKIKRDLLDKKSFRKG